MLHRVCATAKHVSEREVDGGTAGKKAIAFPRREQFGEMVQVRGQSGFRGAMALSKHCDAVKVVESGGQARVCAVRPDSTVC
jgi:hypothetical protein